MLGCKFSNYTLSNLIKVLWGDINVVYQRSRTNIFHITRSHLNWVLTLLFTASKIYKIASADWDEIQRYETLKKKYFTLHKYSSTVLNNLSELNTAFVHWLNIFVAEIYLILVCHQHNKTPEIQWPREYLFKYMLLEFEYLTNNTLFCSWSPQVFHEVNVWKFSLVPS